MHNFEATELILDLVAQNTYINAYFAYAYA